jgi:Domain of unknown function (DUF2760)
MDEILTPIQRLLFAFVAFFAVLFDRKFAEEARRVHVRLKGEAGTPPAPSTPARDEQPAAVDAARPARQELSVEEELSVGGREAAALTILSLLQRDGRLLDFVSEDLTGFSDAEIGAAARSVHEGCRNVLRTYVALEPVFREAEGAVVTIGPGFDSAAVRLTGNVVGQPPFKGSLKHHGWRAVRATLPPPPPGIESRILAPAEVEL